MISVISVDGVRDFCRVGPDSARGDPSDLLYARCISAYYFRLSFNMLDTSVYLLLCPALAYSGKRLSHRFFSYLRSDAVAMACRLQGMSVSVLVVLGLIWWQSSEAQITVSNISRVYPPINESDSRLAFNMQSESS